MRAASICVVALAAATACRVSELDLAPQAPALALAVGSEVLDLPQGLAVLTVVNVSRVGGYGGDVTFSVDGVPSGMRALTSSPETRDGVTSVLLAVGTDTGFATGVYPLTVRASGNGVHDVVGLLTITVTPAGSGVYALEIRPVSVVQGGQVTTLVSINRADFLNVSVRTTAEHVPPGVTATIYPEDNLKALSNMTVAVGRNVAPGQYSFTVRGTTPGLADRVAIVPLTVLPSQP
jgi:hypothetical protein